MAADVDAQPPLYAGAYTADGPGCFRYVYDDNPTNAGRPKRCDRSVEWTGIFSPPAGQSVCVASCHEHSGVLEYRTHVE